MICRGHVGLGEVRSTRRAPLPGNCTIAPYLRTAVMNTDSPDFRVIVASPKWSLNGVNIFSANLVRGLRERNVEARLLLTMQDEYDIKPMPLPSDLPVDRLPVHGSASWRTRWNKMIEYLEGMSPCIYVPNHDYAYSSVGPKLSANVGIVGIIHSDDPQHYAHFRAQGEYWNAIVAVSSLVAEKASALKPHLSSRLTTIPYGVQVAQDLPLKSQSPEAPLRIIYNGCLHQRQKRILDLPKIGRAMLERGVPVEFDIIGGGVDSELVQDASASLVEKEVFRFHGILPNEKVLEMLERSDVCILTSEYEGLPNALLEAMGRGCVPVVSNIESGIPQVVLNGDTGYLVPVGDIDAFAERLEGLYRNPQKRLAMSIRAHEQISQGGYRTQDMVARYLLLFQKVMEDSATGALPSSSWKNQTITVLPTIVEILCASACHTGSAIQHTYCSFCRWESLEAAGSLYERKNRPGYFGERQQRFREAEPVMDICSNLSAPRTGSHDSSTARHSR